MPAPAGPPPHLLSFSALDLAVALAAVACAAAYVFKAELAARLPPLLRLLARRPAAAAAAAAPPLSPARTRASPAAAARPEASESRGTGARDIAQKMKEADKDAVFFFGSQTGTAEEYAARLAKEGAARYSLKTMTADLMDYDASFLDRLPPDKLAFFVLATYGEGEPTDNAIDFWNFLKAAEVSEFSRAACGGEGVGEADGGTEDEGGAGAGAEGEGDERGKKTGKKQLQQPLRNLRYVVYGLGNKTYEHYNAVAKTVGARFAQLGAQSVAPAGYGDDDGNLEDDFIQWKEKMWPDVAGFLGVTEKEKDRSDDVRPPCAAYSVKELSSPLDRFDAGQISRGETVADLTARDQKNPFLARVACTRELYAAASGRHCVHAEIDLTGSQITYEAGDHLAIYPINPDTEVERLGKALGLWEKKDTYVMVEAVDATVAKRHRFPVPSTYETILRHYLDITCIPTRDLLATLASYFPSGTAARARLGKLGSDKAEHESVCIHDRMMLGEILEEIAALQGADALKNVPLFPAIVECLGLLQPRYYSISSSPKLHPRMVHVTASVLQYTSRVKPERKLYGVCTNYLLAIHDMLSGGDIQADTEQRAVYSIRPAGTTVEDVPHREVRVPVFVRRSSFKLPEDPKVPIVMVGPGTGVAPFRGFVQERQWLRRQGVEVGPTLLFFGCRRRDEDYLYWEEWKAAMCEINPESYACTVAHVSARTGAEEAETGADAPEVSDMTAARQDKSNGSVAAPSDASLVGSRSATVQPPSSHLANGRPTPAGEDPDADAAVFVAFSREHPSRKHYVQHRLFELGSRVWALLGPGGGTFYVCGDAKNMAHDVYTALKDVASTMGGMSKEEASKWLKELRAAGRYMEDVWS